MLEDDLRGRQGFVNAYAVLAPLSLAVPGCGTGCECLRDDAPESPAADVPAIVHVRVGVAGKHKLGRWTTVAVTLRGASQPARGRLWLEALDGQGAPCRTRPEGGPSQFIPAQAERQLTGLVKIGRVHSYLKVVFQLDSGQEISHTLDAGNLPDPVFSSQVCVVTIGDSLGIQRWAQRSQASSADSVVTAHAERIADLPRDWQGYGSVDALVLTTSNLETYTQMAQEQVDAIEQWVTLGGRLLLCVGAHGQQLLGGEGKLRRLAPGTFSRVVPGASLPGASTSPLESLSGTAAGIRRAPDDGRALGHDAVGKPGRGPAGQHGAASRARSRPAGIGPGALLCV